MVVEVASWQEPGPGAWRLAPVVGVGRTGEGRAVDVPAAWNAWARPVRPDRVTNADVRAMAAAYSALPSRPPAGRFAAVARFASTRDCDGG